MIADVCMVVLAVSAVFITACVMRINLHAKVIAYHYMVKDHQDPIVKALEAMDDKASDDFMDALKHEMGDDDDGAGVD